MNHQLHRKQIFMLVLAVVLAIASYLIPLPQQSSRSLTKPDSPEVRESAPTEPSSFAFTKWR
jgi:hypothetical protein